MGDTSEERRLSLGGERLRAVYRIVGDEGEARARAEHICLEQTVEFPDDLVRSSAIRSEIYGRVEELREVDRRCFEATISYAAEIAGGELPQLLNVLFGNTSLVPGIRLERMALPGSVLDAFRGPRFGPAGLRELAGGAGRPLTATALKPLGLSPAELAAQATACAAGGLDLVKDDHGLADQPFCPFDERVRRVAEAVAEANQRTGGRCLYAPNVTAPAEGILERAHAARRAGASALVVSAGLTGLDTMRRLAADDGVALPVLMHPALLGSFTLSPAGGVSHYALYGQIARLAGADACIFPHHGGRFTFAEADCRAIAEGAACDMGPLRRSLPAPAGGLRFELVAEVCDFYQGDLIVLIGGDLHRQGRGLAEGSRLLRQVVDRWVQDREGGS